MSIYTYNEFGKEMQCQYNYLILILLMRFRYGKRLYCVKVRTMWEKAANMSTKVIG